MCTKLRAQICSRMEIETGHEHSGEMQPGGVCLGGVFLVNGLVVQSKSEFPRAGYWRGRNFVSDL